MTETNMSPAIDDAARSAEPAVILQAPIPDAKPATPAARGSEDQLPTTRLPSLPSVLPESLERALAAGPPSPPPPPSPPTVVVADASGAKTAPPRSRVPRPNWRALVSGVKHAAVAAPGRVGAVGRAAWSPRRVGVACGVLGLAMIVGALAYGIAGIAGARLDKAVPLEVALILARSAMAIATMCVGYAVLRIGERLSFPAFPLRTLPVPRPPRVERR